MNTTIAWLLVVVLDSGNPYHRNYEVNVEFYTKKICMTERANALKQPGVLKANCYRLEK